VLLNTITLWGLSFDRKWLLRAASWRDQPRHGTPERARAVANGVKMGRPPKLTAHQKKEAIKRRDHGEETLAEIGKSYNVSGWTIARLAP
jgi:hypothetical protein